MDAAFVAVRGNPDPTRRFYYSLVTWIEEEHPKVGVIVADSYKDLASGLSNDDVGSAINIAVQEVIARGREWLGVHHTRKAQVGNKTPRTLDDVYGSTFLTAGLGSVIGLRAALQARRPQGAAGQQARPAVPRSPAHLRQSQHRRRSAPQTDLCAARSLVHSDHDGQVRAPVRLRGGSVGRVIGRGIRCRR